MEENAKSLVDKDLSYKQSKELFDIFQMFHELNVNEHTEKKKTGSTELTYLSWAWAFESALAICPDLDYEILTFENNLPYVFDSKTGYMVFTTVTIKGKTRTMWLPVMDNNNNAMKDEPYSITYKNGSKKVVNAATMFDINKTIMRCLVKNLAMFGLGLYIYAGEDLPSPEADKEKDLKTIVTEITALASEYSKAGKRDLAIEIISKYCPNTQYTKCKDVNVLNNVLADLKGGI